MLWENNERGDTMLRAIDVAKLFIKRGLDTFCNTHDGNMKIQKLLFFANLISLSEKGVPLFSDDVSAFINGCVVEDVRLRYKNAYNDLHKDSMQFNPDFTQDEYEVINLTEKLFGDLSARELSTINHSFKFWEVAFNRSVLENGFKIKELSTITIDEMMVEVPKIKAVIDEFRANLACGKSKEIVNGVAFYYSPDMKMTDEIYEQLELFSKEADDNSYSIYLDEGELVIY